MKQMTPDQFMERMKTRLAFLYLSASTFGVNKKYLTRKIEELVKDTDNIELVLHPGPEEQL